MVVLLHTPLSPSLLHLNRAFCTKHNFIMRVVMRSILDPAKSQLEHHLRPPASDQYSLGETEQIRILGRRYGLVQWNGKTRTIKNYYDE